MLNGDNKRRLVFLAAFLLPIGVVKLASVVMPAGVEAASVEAINPLSVVSVDEGPDWSGPQLAAARHILELSGQSFGPTPMFHQSQHTGGNTDATDGGVDLNVVIEAIMESSRGATALINGKLRGVGDVMPGGQWKITSISSRTVEFTDVQTGEQQTAGVPQP